MGEAQNIQKINEAQEDEKPAVINEKEYKKLLEMEEGIENEENQED